MIKQDISATILFKELDDFFEDGGSEKIKALNSVLNSFMCHEGLVTKFKDEYVEDLLFEVTRTVDFIAAMNEKWEMYKRVHPEVEGI